MVLNAVVSLNDATAYTYMYITYLSYTCKDIRSRYDYINCNTKICMG